MQYKKIEGGYLLRFDLGEELIRKFTEFCREQNVQTGFFHGLGGVTSAEIGYYELQEKEYKFQELSDLVEIISLNGNVALKDDEPFIHMHGVLGDRELRAHGGHIKELRVGGTAEISLTVYDEKIERKPDEQTGLSLLKP
jgi:predicted DNA-binding protein with PD1-like motif